MWGNDTPRGEWVSALALEESAAVGTAADSRSLPRTLSRDEAFGILENERRRLVLELLQQEGDGTSTLSDLAERIAAVENGIERSAISSDQRKRVYIGLYQRHLPKMDDAGVVDYDQRAGDVALTETGADLYDYLDSDPVSTADWPRRYIGVTALGLGLLLVGTGTPTQMTTVTPWLVLAAVVGIYTILSGIHLGQYVRDGMGHRRERDAQPEEV
jgi:hypothetical protein